MVHKVPTFTARITRDAVLFVVGILGIGYETLVVHVDRPTLLILFGGMVGLPVFLRQDEKQPEAPEAKTPPAGDNQTEK